MKQGSTSTERTIGYEPSRTHGQPNIAIHESLGSKAISDIMPEGFDNKTLVADCWAAYFYFKENKTSHQLCTAHLLRELKFFTQKYPENGWALGYQN